MPYCHNCGSKVTDNMHFCPKCGHKSLAPHSSDIDITHSKPFDYTTETDAGAQKQEARQPIKRNKLYKQWVSHASLPDEEVRSKRAPKRLVKNGINLSSTTIYILFGITIIILCTVVVLLTIEL